MKTATRIALLQLLIAVCSAAIWAWLAGSHAALAALSGGGISVFLTVFTAIGTFAAPAADAKLAVMNFYRAEMRKLVLAALLFAAAVRFFGDVFAPVVATFALTLSVYWFALLWDTNDG